MAKDFRNLTIRDWVTPVLIASPLPVQPPPPIPVGPPAPPVNTDPHWSKVRVLLRGDHEMGTMTREGQSVQHIAKWLNAAPVGEHFINNSGITFCPAYYEDIQLTASLTPGTVVGIGPFDPSCDLAAAAAWMGLIPLGATRTVRITPVGPVTLKAGEARSAGRVTIKPIAGTGLPVCAVNLSLVEELDPGPVVVVPTIPNIVVESRTRATVFFNYDKVDTHTNLPWEGWSSHKWLENGGFESTSEYEWRVTILSTSPAGTIVWPTEGLEGSTFVKPEDFKKAFGLWYPFFDAEGYGMALALAVNGAWFGSGTGVNQAVILYEVRDGYTKKNKTTVRITLRAGPGL